MLVYSPYIPIVVRTDYDGLLLSWGFHLFIDAIDILLSCFVFGQFLTQPNSPSSSPLCMLRPKLFTDGHKFSYFLWRIYCGVMTDNNNSNLFYGLLGNDSLQQSDPYSPNNNSKVEYALSMPLVMVLLANEGRVRLPKSMFVLLWEICCVHWLEWINEDTCALCRKLFHSSRFKSWLLGRAGNGECDEMKVTFLNQFEAYFCGITFINRFVKMQWFLQHDRRSFNFCRKQMDIHLDLPRGYI